MYVSYIKEFLAFSTKLNISAVAQDLNMTQPSLSRHLSDMEKELGFELFKRKPKMKLTPEGVAFASEALKILDAYNHVVDVCKKAAADSTNCKLRVQRYVHHNASYLANMKLLMGFRNKYPECLIECFTLFKQSPEEAILSNFLDVAQSASFDSPEHITQKYQELGINAIPVVKEHVVAWMSADNPLAGKPNIALEDIQGERILSTVTTTFNPLNHAFEALCDQFQRKGSFDYVNFENWSDFFLSGSSPNAHSLIITTDQYSDFALSLPKGTIVRRPITDERLELVSYLLVNSQSERSYAQQFAQYALENMPTL